MHGKFQRLVMRRRRKPKTEAQKKHWKKRVDNIQNAKIDKLIKNNPIPLDQYQMPVINYDFLEFKKTIKEVNNG